MAEITVIVPVYKVEQYLDRCVDSIRNQSFGDFDLVLVDDGSPDNCPRMCDAYAAGDQRIHVIHQQNGGLSAARNAGIDWAMANSDSRYLSFVDSDDWLHPSFLSILLGAVKTSGCSISACGFFKTMGEPLPEDGCSFQVLHADDYYCGECHGGQPATAWNKLYQKSLFKTLRYPNGKIHEDEFTTYRLVYAAGKAAVTEARLYAYLQNPAGITGVRWSPGRMDKLDAFVEQMDYARAQKNERLLRKAVECLVYMSYEQLEQAQPDYRRSIRRKLRLGLKAAGELGMFPWKKCLWAYEAAYPCKPLWYVVSHLGKEKHHG